MDIQIEISHAKTNETEQVAALVYELLFELFPNQKHHFPPEKLNRAAVMLLQPGNGVWSFLARHQGNIIGMINLNECVAIYAGGKFGEITEMYIKPEYRSSGIGEQLIQHAKEFTLERAWSVLEVGAPDVPRCQRTVDFYKRTGFNEVGPRLEMMLSE